MADHRESNRRTAKLMRDPRGILALIADNERLTEVAKLEIDKSGECSREVAGARMTLSALERNNRDLKAEIAGLRTGYAAYEQVNAELKAELEVLRKDAERYRWLRDQCGVVEYQSIAGAIGSGMLPSGENLDAALSAAMGQGEQS